MEKFSALEYAEGYWQASGYKSEDDVFYIFSAYLNRMDALSYGMDLTGNIVSILQPD